jgi:methylmalonyl-CoA epimerase
MPSGRKTATPSRAQRYRELVEPIDDQIAALVARRLAICRELDEPDPAAVPAVPAVPAGAGELARTSVRIDHVAIAVRDLDAAIETYRTTLGFELVERRRVEGSGSGMLLAEMRAGAITFVLVQGDSPESNVSRYIEHYGPGVQHIALEVDDVSAVLDELGERGCRLLTGVIQGPGLQQAFTAREPNSGVQLEFISRGGEQGFAQGNIEQLFRAMEREDAY